jgi:quercetin dioxygenase-like cupin family protein
LLPKEGLLNKIGFGLLTSLVALVASTLCLQAAITQQTPTGNKERKAAELRSVDLSSKIDSIRADKLRLRSLTLEPGDIVELHSHKDHSTIIHVIKGTLTSHPQGKPALVLRAGVGFAESKDTNYWVQNTGSEPAEFIWLPVYESTP